MAHPAPSALLPLSLISTPAPLATSLVTLSTKMENVLKTAEMDEELLQSTSATMATQRTEMAALTLAPLRPVSLVLEAPPLLLIFAMLCPLSLLSPPPSLILFNSISSSATLSTSLVTLSHS